MTMSKLPTNKQLLDHFFKSAVSDEFLALLEWQEKARPIVAPQTFYGEMNQEMYRQTLQQKLRGEASAHVDNLVGVETPVLPIVVIDPSKEYSTYRVNEKGQPYIDMPEQKTMKKYRESTQDILLTLAHEYAHHVATHHLLRGEQGHMPYSYDAWAHSSSIFEEGFGTGVEHFLNRTLLDDGQRVSAETTNGTRTIAHAARRLLTGELREAHPDFCTALLRKNIDALPDELGPEQIEYIVGFALFALAEEKYGLEVYAKALKEPRIVLE